MRWFLGLALLLSLSLKSQNSRDTSMRSSNTEYPLAFINHGSFTSLLTNTVQLSGWYKNAGSILIRGINADHSVKFSKSLQLYSLSPVAYDKIQSIYQTNDKGLFFLLNVRGCSNSTYSTYSLNWIIRTDSAGTILFQRFDDPNTFKHIGFISSSFYFKGSTNNLQKINHLTGFQTNNIHVTSGTITATAVNPKKHIALSTNDSLMVIDTLGTMITALPGNFNFEKIYPYKKHYVMVNDSRTILEYRDSAFAVVSSFTLPANKVAKDVYISKDSIYVGMNDLQNNLASICVYDLNFNLLDQKNFTNTNQSLVQLAKEERLQLLLHEKAGTAWNNAIIAQGGDIPVSNASYSTFNKLQDVNYVFDIEVRRIKNLQISASINTGIYTQPAYNYTYINNLVLYNNSADTIRSFCISHPLKFIEFGSSQYCNSNMSYYTYNKTFNQKIAPYDSIELALPAMTGTKFSDASSFPVEFRYSASLPNGKTEKNVSNSQLTYTLMATASPVNVIQNTENIYPNPTNHFLHLPSNSTNTLVTRPYVIIRNVLGQVVFETKTRKNIDVSFLSNGVYFISYEFMGEIRDDKFIKLD